MLAEKYVTNPCMMMQGGSQAIREGTAAEARRSRRGAQSAGQAGHRNTRATSAAARASSAHPSLPRKTHLCMTTLVGCLIHCITLSSL